VRVSVIGSGYVGLNLAVLASSENHTVSVIDVNESLVEKLSSGISHIEGIEDRTLKDLLANKKISFSSDFKVLNESNVVVIAVPTPLYENKNPDLSSLDAAMLSISENIADKTLVINESTSFPGTLRNLEKFISNRNQDKRIYFAVCPERIDPGNNTWKINNTPRILGGIGNESVNKASAFYESLRTPVIVVNSPEIAETAKLFENTFRYVNIALANELAKICLAMEIPVLEVLDAAESKPFGFMRFNPSLGVGGHCIPVDPFYLTWVSKQFGHTPKLIEMSNEIIRDNTKLIVDLVRKEIGGSFLGKRIQVIGVTYKQGISDIRETPALLLIQMLDSEGATITWHDPLVKNWRGETSSPISNDIDFGLIYTAHPEIDLNLWSKVEFPVRYCGPGKIPNFKSIFEK
jgi:UDP-N-acetyl-D-glucosamine dehydrogenase